MSHLSAMTAWAERQLIASLFRITPRSATKAAISLRLSDFRNESLSLIFGQGFPAQTTLFGCMFSQKQNSFFSLLRIHLLLRGVPQLGSLHGGHVLPFAALGFCDPFRRSAAVSVSMLTVGAPSSVLGSATPRNVSASDGEGSRARSRASSHQPCAGWHQGMGAP
jgi:hypothetical protein